MSRYARSVRRLALVGLMVGIPHLPFASPPTEKRSEIPIREVVLSDGMTRYDVPVLIGDTRVFAGLDTGSTGLRLLPDRVAAADMRTGSQPDTYGFGSGVRLRGVVGRAAVTLGGSRGVIDLQAVQTIDCDEDRSNCPARTLPIARYGLMGDGLPGEGFPAILGIGMAHDMVPNPLQDLGVRRWIIDLPRAGEAGPGRMILNPTAEETRDFMKIPIVDSFSHADGALHDALRACIVNEPAREKICGMAILDTGDPGIRIVTFRKPVQPWRNGTPVTLFFANAAGQVHVAERLTTGLRDHASRLTYEIYPNTSVGFIATGLTVYLAYSVLYDPDNGLVGFKPRPPDAAAPRAVIVR